ncbi:penicillin acylase family protein [Parahaliea aestuarii]|nr:penicillin acylase family protein [Parahaliea aestuarii]
MRHATLLPVLALSLVLTACSDSSDNSMTDNGGNPGPPVEPPLEPAGFSAEIRRTEYGIPHIKAEDWGSLGYGYGYAYSQDNFCVTMHEIALAGGRWAELTGEDIDRDLLWRFINGSRDEFKADYFDSLPQRDRDLVTGFAAGMNRYLDETGVDGLPEGENGCRGEPWVYAFDELDLMMYLRKIALQASTDQGIVRDAILAVQGPPEMQVVSVDQLGVRAGLAGDLSAVGQTIRPSEVGSNAIALGADATQSGAGMLLGNPHQPWNGSGRWYEAHLTIPGEYDAAGASLQGLPWIGIGFTRDVAWTHTVDYATRFTLYEVTLNPDNPMQYDYDGEWRDIETRTVAAEELQDDGSLVTVERTFYSTHYGLVLDLAGINPAIGGWPTFAGTLVTLRDANLDTGLRSLRQWVEKSQASNVEEYREALRHIGNPVFHEFAADRHGGMFYGQISAVPRVTQAQLDDCQTGIMAIVASVSTNAFIGLDGSRSACEWGEDPDAPAGTNVYGLDAHPQILGRGAVGNSNNSYWLSDATMPLEGFPVVFGWMGHEGNQQFLRTRITHNMIADRLAGSDGIGDAPLFSLDDMKTVMYLNRVYAAEIVLDDVLAICEDRLADLSNPLDPATREALSETCSVLASWDRKVDVDSRGAQVFTEFWGGIRDTYGSAFQNVVVSDEFWAVDFTATDPLNTPRGIDTGVAANRELVIEKLLAARQRLGDANVALDAPWGEVQFLERNGEPVPIHGGSGQMGVFGAISVDLDEGGYRNPRAGNSYIQVVTWDGSDCPIADTILTHSQSVQPTSEHYSDQTRLYAEKGWVRFPFCEEAIQAAQIGETLLLEQE